MYSNKIHGADHHPDCELYRAGHHRNEDKVSSSYLNGNRNYQRSGRREMHDGADSSRTCRNLPNKDDLITMMMNQDWVEPSQFYVRPDHKLPYGYQAYPNHQIVYNSTVMTQTPPELFDYPGQPPFFKETAPEKKENISAPFRQKSRSKQQGHWKKAFKSVKNLKKATNSINSKSCVENVPTEAQGDSNNKSDIKTTEVSTDHKGDGDKTENATQYQLEKEETIKLLEPAMPIQKVETIKTPTSINTWKIRKPANEQVNKSIEKVSAWQEKTSLKDFKTKQPNQLKEINKESISSIESRKEQVKHIHECIRKYISYVQSKCDVGEETPRPSTSSDVNVRIDADSLLTAFNHPLRRLTSHLSLAVTRSLTDAVINADGASQDPIGRLVQIRDYQYTKLRETLNEFFGTIRHLDKISGIHKRKM